MKVSALSRIVSHPATNTPTAFLGSREVRYRAAMSGLILGSRWKPDNKDTCCYFLRGEGLAHLSKVRWKEVTGEWLVTPTQPDSPTGESANATL